MKRLFYYMALLFVLMNYSSGAGTYYGFSLLTDGKSEKPGYLFNEDNACVEQKNQGCLRQESYGKGITDRTQIATENRGYDVLNYDIFLDWYKPLTDEIQIWTNGKGDTVKYLLRNFTGRNRIRLAVTQDNLVSLDFDALKLVISDIKIDKYPGVELVQPDSNGVLSIFLPQDGTFKLNDTLTVEIAYAFLPTTSNGFFLYPEGRYAGQTYNYVDSTGNTRSDSTFVEERLAYTMSEPQDARLWMPCNDDPADKAFMSMSVRVPEGFVVASNGMLTDSTRDSVGVTYKWVHQYILPTYLMHAAASKFVTFSDTYNRVTNPEVSIPVQYFVWEKDYNTKEIDNHHFNARNMLKTTVEQIETFSSLFIEYPFEKYGIDAVYPFNYGGMEHQTLTTCLRKWFYSSSDEGFAHELAHQWIGDLMTCATWKDIWINEGGASWCEALWDGRKDTSQYYSVLMKKRYDYLHISWGYGGGLKEPAIYGIDINNLFNVPTTYYKSSWVYHMLMEMIGRDKFFPIFRDMLKQYSFDNITTQEYLDYFKAQNLELPITLDTYFDQWLMKRGHPVYYITTSSQKNSDNDYEVKVTLNQTQEGDNIPQAFAMPVELMFIKDDAVVAREKVLNNERTQEFTFNLSFMPDYVRIDSNKVLLEHLETITEVTESKNFASGITVSPNPVSENSNGTITLTVPDYSTVEIALYDVNGKRTEEVYNGMLGSGSYDFTFRTDRLQSGTYLAGININGSYLVRPFIVIK